MPFERAVELAFFLLVGFPVGFLVGFTKLDHDSGSCSSMSLKILFRELEDELDEEPLAFVFLLLVGLRGDVPGLEDEEDQVGELREEELFSASSLACSFLACSRTPSKNSVFCICSRVSNNVLCLFNWRSTLRILL